MKKITAAVMAIGMLGSCQAGSEVSFKGKSYTLRNEENKMQISLNFDAITDDYNGKAVNNYFGRYTVNENNGITFGPAGATMMMGPREEMETEGRYFQTLPQINRFSLEGKKLTLYAINGKELVFMETTVDSE